MSHPLHSFAIISFASSPFIPTSSGHLVLSLIAGTIRGLFFLGERVPGTHNYNHKSKQEKKKSTLHQKKNLFLGYIKCSRDPNRRLGSSSTLCTLVIKPVPFLPNTKYIVSSGNIILSGKIIFCSWMLPFFSENESILKSNDLFDAHQNELCSCRKTRLGERATTVY